MDRELQTVLADVILKKTGAIAGGFRLTTVGGGSINRSYRIDTAGEGSFFLKENSAKNFPHLFELEKQGLQHLASLQCIKTPNVLDVFTYQERQFLLLEYITEGDRSSKFWRRLGEQLALLHQYSRKEFGFDNDNYMGSLSQENHDEDEWVHFFRKHRLMPQVKLAGERGMANHGLITSIENLCRRLGNIFEPEPSSALHGDLWSGNMMCDENQNPVLIDPAVYYGHRSVDLGMTTLFGGFDQQFYSSYNYHFPFPYNYVEQWEICNLYPLLIHLNLFGPSYLGQIEIILRKYS